MILQMNGPIVADEWAWVYEYFQLPFACPKMLRDALAQLPADDKLVLEINSPGGAVWAGFEMYGVLRGCNKPTEAHVIALAASAATTLMIGCDTVLASPVAQIMAHQPAADPGGAINNTETREFLQFLDSVKASILNGYQIKCGDKVSRKKLEQLMDATTWMPVQDAIAIGLVDGLLDSSAEDEAMLQMTAGRMVGVQNAAGGESPLTLLARYEQAVRNGAKPVDGHPVAGAAAETPGDAAGEPEDQPGDADKWQLQARIDLERARAVE